MDEIVKDKTFRTASTIMLASGILVATALAPPQQKPLVFIVGAFLTAGYNALLGRSLKKRIGRLRTAVRASVKAFDVPQTPEPRAFVRQINLGP